HLNIRNFMTFEELEIPTLKRVNLIAGKNNAGKTALLDAIRVLKARRINAVINNILAAREVFVPGDSNCYIHLFNRKGVGSEQVEINESIIEIINFGSEDMNFAYYAKGGSEEEAILLDPNVVSTPLDDLIHVPYQANNENLLRFWGNIDLTPKEDDVLQMLKETVQPNLVKFNISDQVRVRLKDTNSPVLLGTLGDGVRRILHIALSLANAQNNILLIDEIEMGLHYSAMEKLWQMIFKYAHAWDIQVFATTHSQDAIRSFHYVASEEQYLEEAEYIRLQVNRKGEHEAVIYDGQRLKDSIQLELEIR
ncbi:MAG: ATP-binding protein, partial [Bacteroidota bacterium]